MGWAGGGSLQRAQIPLSEGTEKHLISTPLVPFGGARWRIFAVWAVIIDVHVYTLLYTYPFNVLAAGLGSLGSFGGFGSFGSVAAS